MGANYTILGVRPDVAFVGGATVKPVMVSAATTKPHGVYFEWAADAATYTPAGGALLVGQIAALYEHLFEIPGVVDASWTQEVTPAGQLRYHSLIYVQSTSGNSSGVVDYPGYPDPTNVGAQVAALVADLDAAEGS